MQKLNTNELFKLVTGYNLPNSNAKLHSINADMSCGYMEYGSLSINIIFNDVFQIFSTTCRIEFMDDGIVCSLRFTDENTERYIPGYHYMSYNRYFIKNIDTLSPGQALFNHTIDLARLNKYLFDSLHLISANLLEKKTHSSRSIWLFQSQSCRRRNKNSNKKFILDINSIKYSYY